MAETETAAADISIKFRLEKGAVLPKYESSGSSGMDVRSVEDCSIDPGSWKLVSTGLFPEIPEGYEAQVRTRSGMALHHGIVCLNSPGTIDADYRGEIKVILINLSGEEQLIKNGDRIAQLVFQQVTQIRWEEVNALNESIRGAGGFGHTGKE